MKQTLPINYKAGFLLMALIIGLTGIAQAQVTITPPNYTVTTPGAELEFVVNGQSSGQPPAFANVDNSFNFSVNAGATYVFTMNTASIHPVDVCTNPVTSAHYIGASAQAVSSGTVTVTIPAVNFPAKLYYICNVHTFYGIITVNPPQPPPPTTIIKTAISSNIVLTYTGGTNTISMIPQFKSNLVNGTWQAVPGLPTDMARMPTAPSPAQTPFPSTGSTPSAVLTFIYANFSGAKLRRRQLSPLPNSFIVSGCGLWDFVPMTTLLIATRNNHKVEEIRAILS